MSLRDSLSSGPVSMSLAEILYLRHELTHTRAVYVIPDVAVALEGSAHHGAVGYRELFLNIGDLNTCVRQHNSVRNSRLHLPQNGSAARDPSD